MPNRKTLFKLTLFLACAAAILWLGVGCGEEIDPDYPCGQEALKHAIHVREVSEQNRRLFRRQPGFHSTMEHFIRDDEGNWSDEYGIVIRGGERVDQDTLPTEERIPDEIDGVTVYFDETPWNYSQGLIEGVYQKHPEVQYATAAMWKYEDLFFQQVIPNYHPHVHGTIGVGVSPGEPLSVRLGIQLVGKAIQLLEDRIPECVDGLPVIIHVIEPDSE